jgi:hypothetical protein
MYEPCGTCGHDHEYDYCLPGVAEKILRAHLEDGLLARINVDRASRGEPAWSEADLADAMDESTDVLDMR